MDSQKALTLSSFTFRIQPPVSRLHGMSITVYEDGKFNLNGKLSQKLFGKHVLVSFTENAKNVALVENDNENDRIRIPKSGSLQLPAVVNFLKKNKIPLPAKYEVSYRNSENFWQGDYLENPTIAPCKGRLNTK